MNTRQTLTPSSRADRRTLRIAMIAPPWIPVPPPAYGGVESVVALLSAELVARGHAVTLFAAPGSRTPAQVCCPLKDTHPDQIGGSLYESDHVGFAFDAVDGRAGGDQAFDVVHDHSGFTAVAMAGRLSTPLVHTLHAPFNEETRAFYERHAHKADLVAISRYQLEHCPPRVRVAAVVPNPLRVRDWPLISGKQDYLLWMGRMDPAKGAHRAILAAREAGIRLVLAGPVQPRQEDYFRSAIAPHIDGRNVEFLGEVGGEQRRRLFAHAHAFLMPIRWQEPFGLVMVEALACGTPVIAFPEGAASEIVRHGDNGFLVGDELEMGRAVHAAGSISPARCRQSVASRYDPSIVAAGYETVYHGASAGPSIAVSARPTRRARATRQPEAAERDRPTHAGRMSVRPLR